MVVRFFIIFFLSEVSSKEKLKMTLEQKGYLIVIDGPSKIGKTVLCEAGVGRERLVSMTGNDFRGGSGFLGGYCKKG